MRFRSAIAWGFGLTMTVAAAATALAQASPWSWSPQEPQGSYSQTWHNGFRAGEVAANHDLIAKGIPDLSDHADYRNPDLAPVATEQFREGYRFAYQAVVDFRMRHAADPDNQPNDYGHSATD
jgi:hypothetical protein